MRNYVATQAQSRISTAGFANVLQVLRNWRSRRVFAKLHTLTDHQLKDIGLNRAQLNRLAGLPLSVDPVWEAERLRLLASHRVK